MNNPLDKLLSGEVKDPRMRYEMDDYVEDLSTIGEVMAGHNIPGDLSQPTVEGPRLPINGGEVVFPSEGDAPYYVTAASVEEL